MVHPSHPVETDQIVVAAVFVRVNCRVATDVDVYFCDPQSPWQRGSNENTNGLLRQYLPKGSDLSVYSQNDLDAIALSLNTRPRKTLGFRTPGAMLAEAVALID